MTFPLLEPLVLIAMMRPLLLSALASVVFALPVRADDILYQYEGDGFYVDEAPISTVGRSSFLTLAFGIFGCSNTIKVRESPRCNISSI